MALNTSRSQRSADLLRLNQQTVRNMLDRGELRAVRVGSRRVRIRRADLDAFLAAGAAERPQGRASRDELRVDLASALEAARSAVDDDRELAGSLRTLSVAAMRLAQEIEREAITSPRSG